MGERSCYHSQGCARSCTQKPDGIQHEDIPSIEVLPNQCLYEILRHLADPEKNACTMVSKHWLGILATIS
ncbi:EIN3-binding F-box protein 2-like protein [Drosera capensis]